VNGREEFARYIKAARENMGLSKFSAGKGLGYQSDGTINAIEQGRMPLPVEQIHRIAKLYNLDVEELLSKIAECEPRLYHRYEILQEDIIAHFAKRVVGQRTSISEADQAKHHLNLTNELLSKLTYSISYQKLQTMNQMDLELHERAGYDAGQRRLGFRHARHPRIAGFHPPRDLHRHQLRAAA